MTAGSERPFRDQLAERLDAGRPVGLVAVRSTRAGELARERGAQAAELILAQLERTVRAGLPDAPVGRLDGDAVGALLEDAAPDDRQRRADRLARAVRESSRWPAAVGLALSEGVAGGPDALQRLALAAADEAAAVGEHGAVTHGARGPVPRPMDAPAPAGGSTLETRYQRLTLLNRLSLALFADKPFSRALADAASAALALTGARAIAVSFADETGRLAEAHRHGDAPAGLLEDAAAEAQRERRLVTSARDGRFWTAAPLLRVTPDHAVVEGVVAFAFDRAPASDAESESLVVEIARHLRNARVIQRALRQQKIFAEVFARSADALFVTDADGRVLSWNDAAEELFGWEASEIVGRHGSMLVPESRRQELLDLLARIEREGQVGSVETERLRKDGTAVAVEGSFAALRDPEGRFIGVFRSYRDITRRKEVERMKSEFVSLVSHELRTPLTAIRGFAETLGEFWGELGEDKKKQYLGIMLEESKRLSQMVTDFLDIARLESGGIETVLTEVRPEALFARAAELFQKHPSGARMATRVGPGAGKLRGDEEQLYRLLVNLAGNALKYSPPGGTVTLAAEADGSWLELSVSDEGPGIAKKDQARLFEKFFRAGDAVTKKTPGTGLGLAICKGIAEAHGGSIRVESAPGQGARFVARLPLDGPSLKAG